MAIFYHYLCPEFLNFGRQVRETARIEKISPRERLSAFSRLPSPIFTLDTLPDAAVQCIPFLMSC